ncbi:hypothetical protein SKAU_G00376680 [Synaphobranchus kaupii]|uniref:Uncharacterized protein n=1 Tax=Synaphobranchus kaupii TaxID=118154 RepID=A0A9Q1IC85_SYNKA|nr:hypothetical protein SKAU_G00376680 [Synaphobranchus kaupii]
MENHVGQCINAPGARRLTRPLAKLSLDPLDFLEAPGPGSEFDRQLSSQSSHATRDVPPTPYEFILKRKDTVPSWRQCTISTTYCWILILAVLNTMCKTLIQHIATGTGVMAWFRKGAEGDKDSGTLAQILQGQAEASLHVGKC